MTHLTTHVLDAATGTPAVDVAIELADARGTVIATGSTDADGRLALGPDRLEPGIYALTFDTGGHFARSGTATFYPSATVSFTVGDEPHLHVPLLLSPFAYSTYRGS
jgi:5-hydroxyisourate hydrolase